MKVLVVGSGGREHALAWKLSQSPKVKKLYAAPGNTGTAALAENVDIGALETNKLVDFATQNNIDFVVVGPDDVLAAGLVDVLEAAGVPAFGPTKPAAQIEASKSFAKEIMQAENVPTADYQTFEDFEAALDYVKTQDFPLFIKADGLALGKGAVMVNDDAEAQEVLTGTMLDNQFGEAGKRVVIESYLDGPEFSLHAFCDGQNYKMLPSAQDHKPIFDGDKGPNTGGMGTVAPLPWLPQAEVEKLGQELVAPIIAGLQKKGVPYKGLLYPGVKMTSNGPKVLEYNARFGDPETQVYMRLLETDLLDVLMASRDGTLGSIQLTCNQKYAVCVVLASAGYPASSQKGIPIEGLEKAEKLPDVVVFHAGTKLEGGVLQTNGGRVLGVTAIGNSVEEARQKAYTAVDLIKFEGKQYRKDIGFKSLE